MIGYIIGGILIGALVFAANATSETEMTDAKKALLAASAFVLLGSIAAMSGWVVQIGIDKIQDRMDRENQLRGLGDPATEEATEAPVGEF